MDTYDITGLDPKSAKEYVLAAVTALKATKGKVFELEKESELWTKRVELASEQKREDLVSRAEARKAEVTADLGRIRAEEAELNGGVIRLKGQLRLILNQPELSMDADLLAAQLELMDEEPDKLAVEFQEVEANDALERFKAEIEKEGEEK